MKNLKEMNTDVLKTIMQAYTTYYGRILSEEEKQECQNTIELIKKEIAEREGLLNDDLSKEV